MGRTGFTVGTRGVVIHVARRSLREDRKCTVIRNLATAILASRFAATDWRVSGCDNSGVWDNNGWFLGTTNGRDPDWWNAAILKFHSAQATTAGYRPRLNIYTTVPDTVTMNTGGTQRVGATAGGRW
jgi:hypothetical protein